MSGRLARGRNYAPARARCWTSSWPRARSPPGCRARGCGPTRCRSRVLPLTAAQWRRVEARLAEPGAVPGQAAGGRDAARDRGGVRRLRHAAVPRVRRATWTMRCNCPDWGVPCKHLAAVCYVLAEAFDDDPFAMLAWRGKEPGRTARGAARQGGGPGRRRAPADEPARRLAGDSPALAVLADVTGRAAGGVAGGLLVARAEPGPAARRPAQPRRPARPAAPPLRPAARSRSAARACATC